MKEIGIKNNDFVRIRAKLLGGGTANSLKEIGKETVVETVKGAIKGTGKGSVKGDG